jgi:DNA-binding transcriptional LysR family regulator
MEAVTILVVYAGVHHRQVQWTVLTFRTVERTGPAMRKLDDLALFAAVAERGGYAAAARSLGMQRSKLSRRLAGLEQHMGVRLLQRNTRRVSLTSAGEQVYRHARVLVDEANAAFDVAAELHGEPRGVLRLTCPGAFAATALVPVISEFCGRHPQLHVLIEAGDRRLDLVGEGFDLAFRAQAAPLDDSNLVARLIGPVPMMMAVSPRLLSQGKALKHPEQLSELGVLAHETHEGMKTIDFTQGKLSRYTLRYTPRMLSGNMTVLQSAVIEGMGVACVPRYLCGHHLANGQIADALDVGCGWKPQEAQVYAVMPARRGVPPATRLLLEFAMPRLAARLRA